ncbi:MAG: hypothetical protein R3E86_17805 [Pseudomonadales bacterium]
MNVQPGFGFSYPAWPGYNFTSMQAAPAAAEPGAAAAPASQPAASAPSAAAAPQSTAQPSTAPFLLGYMAPAYLMVAPQMGYPAMTAAGSGAAAMPATTSTGATAQGGHVVSNPTNSLTSSAYPQYGGAMASPVGGFGMMPMLQAMPVFMSPVFVAFGLPVFMAYPQQVPAAAGAAPGTSSGAVEPLPAPAPELPAGDAVDDAAAVPADASDDADGTVKLPIESLNAADYQKFRLRHLQASLETSLKLELKTRDGDVISLDFSQLDSLDKARFRGREHDGDRVRFEQSSRDSQRVVNMSVAGDLSEAEQAAVDQVLARVVEVANGFFGGSVGDALARLQDLEFDSGQLAEFSLKMSMSRSVDVNRYYQSGGGHEGRHGDAALRQLAGRDGDVRQMLEFFADAQRSLIESASEVLDGESAVHMVKSLLPPLLDGPIDALKQQVAEGGDARTAVTDTDADAVAADDVDTAATAEVAAETDAAQVPQDAVA